MDSTEKITKPNNSYSIAGKTSAVFTTASNTDLRLAKTETLTYKAASQPLENEVSVFVNPNKTFQTIVGIGGAITDASAEIFAQLPDDKQEELLTAYYDVGLEKVSRILQPGSLTSKVTAMGINRTQYSNL